MWTLTAVSQIVGDSWHTDIAQTTKHSEVTTGLKLLHLVRQDYGFGYDENSLPTFKPLGLKNDIDLIIV